jgi:hypothetical protein
MENLYTRSARIVERHYLKQHDFCDIKEREVGYFCFFLILIGRYKM